MQQLPLGDHHHSKPLPDTKGGACRAGRDSFKRQRDKTLSLIIAQGKQRPNKLRKGTPNMLSELEI